MFLVSSAAVDRATISELPPGANGTTNRTGFWGQGAWAKVRADERPSAAAPSTARRVRGNVIRCLQRIETMMLADTSFQKAVSRSAFEPARARLRAVGSPTEPSPMKPTIPVLFDMAIPILRGLGRTCTKTVWNGA